MLFTARAGDRMTKIAILLSASSFEGFFGGVFALTPQQYVHSYRNDFSWYYAKMLAGRGFDVTIMVPSFDSEHTFTTSEGIHVSFLRLAGWYRKMEKAPVWRGPVMRYCREVLNTAAFLRALREALHTSRIDMLYIQEYWTGRFDLLTRMLDGTVKIVGADHGGSCKRQLTWFKSGSFSRAMAITAQTAAEAADVGRFSGKATIIPNPIDCDYFHPAPPARPRDASHVKIILTVARFTNHQKRTTDLIEAMAHLDGNWRLLIAGDGPDRALLEAQAAALGAPGKVQFLGFLSDRARLRELYRQCDVFCLPSLFEGLPMVVLEAMSCGCALVLTDIRAYSDLVVDGVNAVLAPVGEPAKLAEAILRAHRNETLGAQARQTIVQKFSIAAFMKRFPLPESRDDAGVGHLVA
jgi:glycosyltransferase involved in cell wall biosynthesis